jgi:hypothetical protein
MARGQAVLVEDRDLPGEGPVRQLVGPAKERHAKGGGERQQLAHAGQLAPDVPPDRAVLDSRSASLAYRATSG